MDKRKLNRSKLSGKMPPDDAGTEEVLVMIHCNEPGYAPQWLTVRHRITETIFTASIRKADFDKLEADDRVVSFSINEQLDPL